MPIAKLINRHCEIHHRWIHRCFHHCNVIDVDLTHDMATSAQLKIGSIRSCMKETIMSWRGDEKNGGDGLE